MRSAPARPPQAPVVPLPHLQYTREPVMPGLLANAKPMGVQEN